MEFYLERDEDESGVSGTGRVAHGVVFDDGTVSMRWLTEYRSTATYRRLDDVWRIHSHGGKTRLVPHRCSLAVVDHGSLGAAVVGVEGDRGFFMLINQRDEVEICATYDKSGLIAARNSALQTIAEIGGKIAWGVFPPYPGVDHGS